MYKYMLSSNEFKFLEMGDPVLIRMVVKIPVLVHVAIYSRLKKKYLRIRKEPKSILFSIYLPHLEPVKTGHAACRVK